MNIKRKVFFVNIINTHVKALNVGFSWLTLKTLSYYLLSLWGKKKGQESYNGRKGESEKEGNNDSNNTNNNNIVPKWTKLKINPKEHGLDS